MHSLVFGGILDSYEGREVAIFDVQGAYLQADLKSGNANERILLKLTDNFYT